jgi:plastocyanin
MTRTIWPLLLALLAATFVVGVACGGDDDDGGPIEELTQQAGTTPSGGGATRAPTQSGGAQTPSTGQTPSGTAPATTPGAGGGQQVMISADSLDGFSTDTLSAPAGSVTIVFQNNDQGVPHNFALFDSPDSPDNLIDATDIEAGPSTQQLTVDLEAGQYYYHCDVHPTTMKGVLTVS